jgi:antitoxin (DNA-binding transcriptional repressor) of toxin-antitoxin stability system
MQQLQMISTKELRNNLPKIIESLKKGNNYTLIYRSKPVAQLNSVSSSHEGLKKLLELGPKFRFKSKKSAVELIREERD